MQTNARALLFALATASCSATPAELAKPPAAHPAAAPDPRSQDYDDAETIYRRGRADEALKRWRTIADYPAAAARLAVLGNHPEAALALPMTDDLRLLKAEARAAVMLGDVDSAERALARASPLPSAAPFATALGAWIRTARLGRARPILRATGEEATSVALDVLDGLPIVDVQIGTETSRFLLDTGAETTMIDARSAAKLGVRLASEPPSRATSVAGNVEVSVGLIDRATILGLTLEDIPVGVVDLSALDPYRIVGAIGMQQLFRRDVVTIDYGAKRAERSRRSRDEGWSMVLVDGRFISVEGSLHGGQQGLFQIETGVSSPMVTSPYLDVALALHAPWDVGGRFERTNRGMGGAGGGKARAITGAAFCPRGEPACVDLGPILAWDALASTVQSITQVEQFGVLGGSAFEHSAVEIDYPALRLRVRPSD